MSPFSFLIKKTNIKTGKSLLFYLTATIWVLAYTLLAFNVSLILSDNLSVFFVGLFMSITSLIAIFADIPMGHIQKNIPARLLLFFSVVGLIVTTTIFLGSQSAILLSFLAVLIYGLSHDLYDITMLSYIFEHSHPQSYSQNISQKNVAEALGLLTGLGITSTFGLLGKAFSPLWIVLIIFFIAGLFVLLFFDKTEYDVQLSELDTQVFANKFSPDELIKNLKNFIITSKTVALDKIEEAKNGLKSKIQKGEIVALKPIKPIQKFEESKFKKEFKESMEGVSSIFSPPRGPLVWSSVTVAFFSMWDTFVITFQPIFIAKTVLPENGMSIGMTGVIIALFVIPLFICQVPFSKLADKLGRPLFMYIGLAVSGVSIFAFSFSHDVVWIVLMGLSNSIGYAAAFPAAQGFFAQRFQENFALLHATRTIDSNVSAGPLKMIINFGNVLGQLIGGALITGFGFDATFMVLGIFVLVVFGTSLLAAPWVTGPITGDEDDENMPGSSLPIPVVSSQSRSV